jgi:pilus assembly protein CpaF
MVAMANLNIPDKAVRQQIASAVNIVIQVNRLSDGTRRLTSISEITGMEQDVITMQEIFQFKKSGIGEDGRVIGAFRATGIRPKCSDQLATAGFPLPMEMFDHVHNVGGAHKSNVASMAARR